MQTRKGSCHRDAVGVPRGGHTDGASGSRPLPAVQEMSHTMSMIAKIGVRRLTASHENCVKLKSTDVIDDDMTPTMTSPVLKCGVSL